MSESGESDDNYEEKRKLLFERYRTSNVPDPRSIFNMPAIKFRQFNSTRIVFRFWPHKLVDYVLQTVSFLCVMRFNGKYWRLKRDTFPVNYKWRIYKMFWNRMFFTVTDDNVLDVIVAIYGKLCEWSRHNSVWRLDKFKRYQEGDSDVSLDSDDEKLFLSEEDRAERANRIAAIHKRMIPPPLPRKTRKRRKVAKKPSTNL